MYEIRMAVLNMPLEMWRKLPECETISISAEDFLGEIGLPGGLSAKFNEQERAFFDVIYALSRLTPNAADKGPA